MTAAMLFITQIILLIGWFTFIPTVTAWLIFAPAIAYITVQFMCLIGIMVGVYLYTRA